MFTHVYPKRRVSVATPTPWHLVGSTKAFKPRTNITIEERRGEDVIIYVYIIPSGHSWCLTKYWKLWDRYHKRRLTDYVCTSLAKKLRG